MRKTFESILKTAFIMLIASSPAWGENISISQLDTSRLFISSTVDCYVRITDKGGKPLEIKNPGSSISLTQTDESGSKPLKVLETGKNSESSDGITFMLLLDNSGSMYEKTDKDPETERISAAVRAARTFFSRLDQDRDSGGVAVFNRDFSLLAQPGMNLGSINDIFETIEKPTREESYTELYYTIIKAAGEMGKTAGRKAIILLSDGENYPYFKVSGKQHPELGDKSYLPGQAAEALSENEVTLYAVNFSKEKDIPLAEIAVTSGGRVFDASNEEELTGVYENIRKSINEEFRIRVRVPVTFSKAPSVDVNLNNTADDSMSYSPALIFGTGSLSSPLPALILIITGVIILAVLLFLKLEKEAHQAELTQLLSGRGRGRALEKTMLISSQNTVIGGSASADYTITGIPSIRESHATIVRDEKTDSYTLVSSNEVRVNNRAVKKRVLKPGDVINIEGATMVFDAPEKTIVKK